MSYHNPNRKSTNNTISHVAIATRMIIATPPKPGNIRAYKQSKILPSKHLIAISKSLNILQEFQLLPQPIRLLR